MSNFSTKDAVNAQQIWGLSSAEVIQANQASQRYRMKHGMFAGIPLLCKDNACPYSRVCSIPQGQRTPGGRCPVEIGAIMTRYDSWCKHFGIDTESEFIKDEDLVDASLIRDLVDNEIQTLRAENKLALSGDFIGQTLQSVDNKGNEHYVDAVTPEAQFKLTLIEKRQKILTLLNSTRKDKAKDVKAELDPSMQAISIFNKINSQMKSGNNAINLDLDSIGGE